jgi:hypothetical protein
MNPSDIELQTMCDDIGATFSSEYQAAAVDGTNALIMTRCTSKSLSAQPTPNRKTLQNNISKWHRTLEELEKEYFSNPFEFIMGNLGKALKERPSLDEL